jgi:phosphate transport system substrate-binding protein
LSSSLLDRHDDQGDAVRSYKWLAAVGAGALALGGAACGSSDDSSTTASSSGGSSTGSSSGSSSSGGSVTINGAGSTFAAPIYQDLASKLKDQGVTVNYQGVGSGAGVEQLTSGTVDFAGSDPPLKDEEAAAIKGKDAVHVPVAFGSITVSYNLDGVKSGLKLDGETLSSIFLGTIKKWNDPAIAKLNPGMSLPSTDITVVHRSDSSGTTAGFTGFLDSVSKTWHSKVGTDKTVNWPTGTGAKGNDGVAAAVKQTPGAVGYVEQAYALQNNFTFANVENSSGKFVAPSIDSTSAAGEGLDIPADLRFKVTNPKNPAAYPIVSQTFLIMHKDLCAAGLSKAKAAGLKKFAAYTVGSEGQAEIKNLSFAPLPAAIDQKATAVVNSLECNGTPIS